jgi:hypothetical protein
MTQWRRIDALTTEPGPFIWRTSRTAMTPIALGWPRPQPADTAIHPATAPVRYDPT